MRPRRLVLILAALAATAALSLALCASALAAGNQISMFQDDPNLDANPPAVLSQLRLLGATSVKVALRWSWVAPNAASHKAPRNFNASNPAAYPAKNWALYDSIVRDATADGIAVSFDLGETAPLWATGPGAPPGQHWNWEPSPSAFAAFVRAVGTRYSGRYTPGGASTPLPRVSSWAVWSEPNLGYSLAPQGVPGHLTIENSGHLYRGMVGAAWGALNATGHHASTDTIMIGELGPRGDNYWGVFASMKPLVFLRALYCVDSNYRPLRGAAASIRGCPATAAASRRFRANNPGLFQANGFSDHLWARWYPPNVDPQHDPNYSGFPDMPQFQRALDRAQRAYGSYKQFKIYNTEFGYITNPPNHTDPFLSPAKAADYLNWAEYISWRNPRIESYSQYVLQDPPAKRRPYNLWSAGLLNVNGTPKATYDAWRMPLYLPVTSAHPGRSLEVWGCVRPSHYAILEGAGPQTAQIQFAASGKPFQTVRTVTISRASDCYFDVHVTPPSSGTFRVQWQYPPGYPNLGEPEAGTGPVYSRGVAVTIH